MTKLQPITLYVLGGFLLSILSLCIWLSVNGLQQSQVFGLVTQVTDVSITVADRQSNEQTFMLDDTVRVQKRKETLPTSALTVGDFVHLTQTVTADGVSKVDTIRLMHPPKKSN
jgi:hypothetical protein